MQMHVSQMLCNGAYRQGGGVVTKKSHMATQSKNKCDGKKTTTLQARVKVYKMVDCSFFFHSLFSSFPFCNAVDGAGELTSSHLGGETDLRKTLCRAAGATRTGRRKKGMRPGPRAKKKKLKEVSLKTGGGSQSSYAVSWEMGAAAANGWSAKRSEGGPGRRNHGAGNFEMRAGYWKRDFLKKDTRFGRCMYGHFGRGRLTK